MDEPEFGVLVEDVREHGICRTSGSTAGRILDSRDRHRAGQHACVVRRREQSRENWTRVLKNDRRAQVVAAGTAQGAADHILDRQAAGADGQRGRRAGA